MATAAIPTPKKPAPAPIPTTEPNAPDKFADAQADGLKIGSKVFMTAVHGRIIHPNKVPLEFNIGDITKVEVDSWVLIQYEAGKLALASDE